MRSEVVCGCDVDVQAPHHARRASESAPEQEVPVEGPFHELAYFYANVFVGSPPQKATVIADTGSTRMAFPCTGCPRYGGCCPLHVVHSTRARGIAVVDSPMSPLSAATGTVCFGVTADGCVPPRRPFTPFPAVEPIWIRSSTRLCPPRAEPRRVLDATRATRMASARTASATRRAVPLRVYCTTTSCGWATLRQRRATDSGSASNTALAATPARQVRCRFYRHGETCPLPGLVARVNDTAVGCGISPVCRWQTCS